MEKFRGIQSKTSDVRWQLRFFFGILAVVTAANAVMLHLLSIPILPLFYLVAAVVYLVFSRVIDLRNFVFGYVCSFLMVAAQCIPFVYVLGDVDLFKQINDQYGHEAGDEVLIRLGQLFRTHIPTGAVVCRWGGEE